MVLIALVACGGDGDVEPELLSGSPDATRALAFTASGRLVAIGGTSSFGLAYLQHQDGDAWVRAANVPGFGTRAQLIGGGPSVPLFAASDTTLYSLDETTMTWDGITIPAGATTGTVFGADGDGRIYALDVGDGDGNGAVVTWMPGDARWVELAGTRPLGPSASQFVVEAAGRVTWVVEGAGVVRADAGAQAAIVTCSDLGDCSLPIEGLSYDDVGALTLVTCPREDPPRFAIRLAGDDAVPQQIPLPSEISGCIGLDTAPDGTTVLAGFGYAEDGVLAILPPRSTTWRRVSAASQGRTYVIRDRSSVFAFGDAQLDRNIYVIDLD